MPLYYNPFYSLVENSNTNELEGAQLSSERIKIVSLKDLDENTLSYFDSLGYINSNINAPEYMNMINAIRPIHFHIRSNTDAGKYEQYDTVIFQPCESSSFARVLYYKFDKKFVNMIRKFDELKVGLSAFSERKKIYRH